MITCQRTFTVRLRAGGVGNEFASGLSRSAAMTEKHKTCS